MQPREQYAQKILKKLERELPYRPSNSTSGDMSAWNATMSLKGYLYSCVHCSIHHNSQGMRSTQMSAGRWTGKGNVVDTCRRILISISKRKKSCHSWQHVEPVRHYAEGNSRRKKENTAWSHLLRNLSNQTQRSGEYSVVTRRCVRGNGQVSVRGY